MNDLIQLTKELRRKGDWCHNNIGSKTWEDWESMDKFLVSVADRIEQSVANCDGLANKAKARAVLEAVKRHLDGYVTDVRELRKMVEKVLEEPPRNCDKYPNSHEAEMEYCRYLRELGLKNIKNDEPVHAMEMHEWLYAKAKNEGAK